MSDPVFASTGLQQQQFLQVIDREEAAKRFNRYVLAKPLGAETIPLAEALERVLSAPVIAPVDVPGFDRASVDGFAVRATDTVGAGELTPATLRVNREVLTPGIAPQLVISPGSATPIATGGMLPRGADAIVMIEYTELSETPESACIQVTKPVLPGQYVAFAGTDVAKGETVLRTGQFLTSREIGVLAAIGIAAVAVYRKPRVAIFSTGDEIISPGTEFRRGAVYDSNSAILAAAVREAGGEPWSLGIVVDDEAALGAKLEQALQADMVLLSGGTSKGAGDLSYRCVAQLNNPGIVAHGVALKPGKPICLAVTDGKPVVVLPGFPTSAIFNFHEFIAPVIRRYAGLPEEHRRTTEATVPVPVHSELGRTEYILVNLIHGATGWAAYPIAKGSGAVTAFSCADGFITVDQHTEALAAGSAVQVQLLGQRLEPADLVFVGSQCSGLDRLHDFMQARGIRVKCLYVGSMGGLLAARRGECDVAGVHLMDPATETYNTHLLAPGLRLAAGYRRMQGVAYRPDDLRFTGKPAATIIDTALNTPDCTMVNRNAGSGTRILIDRLLAGQRPPGYALQPKSHNAVAAAIAQGRADWGIAIDVVARQYQLAFAPLQEEHYDFIIPEARLARPAVQIFLEVLHSTEARLALTAMGFLP